MSARNNEARLGVSNPDADAPIEQLDKSDGFSFVTPTEFVDLPTGGAFYPEGHPLQNQDSIEIRYMTAKDEDILTSQTLLKKGVAIDRLLQNVIVDKSVRVDDLYVGDKNALVVAARITGYGEDYDVSISCPTCGEPNSHVVDLSDLKINKLDETLLEDLNIEKTQGGTFIINLPRSKVNVEVKLLTGRDERNFLVSSENKKKHNLPESVLTDQMKLFITSVNGDEKKDVVSSFVNNMPAYDSRYLRKVYSEITPNVKMECDFVCPECNASSAIDVPFTTAFFWPK